MEGTIPYVGAVAAITSGIALYKVARPFFNVKVNCWFCNGNTVVPYGNKNCWDCPHCDQYNGFTQEGDYNKPIPAQRDDLLNHLISASAAKEPYTPPDNNLCEACNRNLLLKIKQLANFVPIHEANYDNEIESFKEQLEYAYRLCRNCQATVCHQLARQDHKLRSKLLDARLKDSDTSSIYGHIMCKVHTPLHVSLLRFTSLLCAVTLLLVNAYHLNEDSPSSRISLAKNLPRNVVLYTEGMYRNAHALVFMGLFSGIGAIFLHGKHRLYLVDAMTCFTWLGLIVLHYDMVYLTKIPGVELSDVYLLQTGVSLFCAFLSLWCALCSRTRISSNRRHRRKRGRFDLDSSHMSCDSSVAASQAGDISLASDLDNWDGASQLSWSTSQQEPSEPVDSQLDGLSLGTPQKRTPSTGMFSRSAGNAFLSPSVGSLASLTNKRPLISPARFSPSISKARNAAKQRLFTQTKMSAGNGSNGAATPCESVNEASDHSSSSSSSSSQCPVDTTTHLNENNRSGPERRISLSHVILFASLAINVGLVFYLITNKYLDVLIKV